MKPSALATRIQAGDLLIRHETKLSVFLKDGVYHAYLLSDKIDSRMLMVSFTPKYVGKMDFTVEEMAAETNKVAIPDLPEDVVQAIIDELSNVNVEEGKENAVATV